MRASLFCGVMFWVCHGGAVAYGEEFFVGEGSEYTTINAALSAAQDGDVVTVRTGRYEETIETQGPGITIRSAGDGEVLVTQAGYVLRVRHERTTIDGVVLDGQYSDRDGVQVRGEAHQLLLRNVEVRHIGNDCVDLGSQHDVTIDGCLIHHCLRATRENCSAPDCREDAHGISGAAVRNLTVRNTEIHTVSGDAIQVDPGRNEPGWSGLVIEGCRLWSQPLPEPVGGFARGVVTAENALDTKTSNDVIEPAEVTIRDTHVWGFRGGLIGNMAAFNLKENVRVHLDRVTVNDSEIALRLRGRTNSRPRGAQVSLSNTVIYDVDTAIRYEDGIEVVQIDSTTIGLNVNRVFDDVSEGGRVEGRNILVLADTLPAQLEGPSHLAVDATCFVNAAESDYHLNEGCPAIDRGQTLNENVYDRSGTFRPQGAGWEIGAFEFCAGECDGAPTADGGADASGARDAGPDARLTTLDAGRPMDAMGTPLAEDSMAPRSDALALRGDTAPESEARAEHEPDRASGGCSSVGTGRFGGVFGLLIIISLASRPRRRRRAAR
jgi:hypothetical protein